jgi:hypothetical protein
MDETETRRVDYMDDAVVQVGLCVVERRAALALQQAGDPP